MSVAAVHMIKPWIKNKTITLYNDNPGAAAALRTKAPPLNRMDLQSLILTLADLAYERKFVWCWIHQVVKESWDMSLADKLSRFQSVPWVEKVRYMDITDTCNELFDILWEAPRNVNKEKDIPAKLRILYGLQLDDVKQATKSSTPLEHNILRNGVSPNLI